MKINIIKELYRNFNQTTKTLFILCLKNLNLETLQLTNKTKTWKAITIILHKSCVAPVFLMVKQPSKFDFSDSFVQESSTDIQNCKSWPCRGVNLVGCSVSLQKRNSKGINLGMTDIAHFNQYNLLAKFESTSVRHTREFDSIIY